LAFLGFSEPDHQQSNNYLYDKMKWESMKLVGGGGRGESSRPKPIIKNANLVSFFNKPVRKGEKY